MNIDFIQLWHSLERLPLLISITVYLLVIFCVVAFVALPFVLIIRSEPRKILQDFRADRESFSHRTGLRRSALSIASWLTVINTAIGRTTAWLVLYMTLMQFVVVLMRYVFSYGMIPMQESIWYMHGILFMLGAGYTLVKDGHVRLDVFYREAERRTKAAVNVLGCLFFLFPFCYATFSFGWSLVLNSWAVREGSLETGGLPFIYLFKTVILVFAVIVAIEGLALLIRSLVELSDRDEIDLEPIGE